MILPRSGSFRHTFLKLLLAGFAGLMLLYACLVVRFHTGQVRLSRNIAAEINAPTLAVPENQRAWTHYRRISLAMEPLADDVGNMWGELRPGDPLWPEAKAYLERNSTLIDELRRATELPVMGTIITNQEDLALRSDGDHTLPPPGPPAGNPMALGLLYPQLGKSRAFARLLKEDTYSAAESGDAPRVSDNLRSLARLARQNMGENAVTIEHLVGIAVLSLADSLAQEIIVRHPSLLNDEQWAAVDRDFAVAAEATPLSLNAERGFLADIEQRLFTDDGSGDGRVNADSLTTLSEMKDGKLKPLEFDQQILGPFLVLGTSRRAFREMGESIHNEVQFQAGLPRWERESGSLDDVAQSVIPEPRHSTFEYRIVSILIPALGKALRAQDQIAVTTHATRTAIALARHHLRHGVYPAALADIDPDLVTDPEPFDVFDGLPLRYRLIDGWPVIYSIGNNAHDDGGMPPAPLHQNYDAFHPRNVVDGDWILFPPIETNSDRLITTPGPWPADRRAP